MFIFTLPRTFHSKGVTSDLIPPASRNRFDGLFGQRYLDGRLQVRLQENAIHFFYYQGGINDPLKVEKWYKEIASISLTDVKETEHDILYLSEQCKEKCQTIKWHDQQHEHHDLKNWTDNITGLTGNSQLRWFSFPFIDNVRSNDSTNIYDRFVLFFQCCFLFFVLDFENRESDFSKYPGYDDIRKKLRKSIAYKLLCAKIKFLSYLFEGNATRNNEEFAYKAGIYSDLLMDSSINEIIPPSYYNRSLWFYNPEVELERIVKKEIRGEKESSLQPLNKKIRDFFYRKHAVISAAINPRYCWTRPLYIVYLLITAIFSLYATFSNLFYDSNVYAIKAIADFYFEHFAYWAWLSLGIIAILVILGITNSNLNVFMPRVLVAISIGWLTAFISEDLIKSQLEIPLGLTIAAFGGVLFIVGILLFGEAKQHSPYYQPFKQTSLSSLKLIPVIGHSYYWTLVLGTAMQLYIYPGLLENSKALPEIVYEDTFDDAENYVLRLTNFKDALVSYRQNLDETYVKTTISGVEKSPSNLSFLKADLNYSERELDKIKNRRLAKIQHINQVYDDIYSIVVEKKSYLDSIVSKGYQDRSFLINNVDSVSFGPLLLGDVNKNLHELSESAQLFSNKMSPSQIDISVNKQLACLDEIIDATEEEIQHIKLFSSDKNKYSELIEWSTNQMVPYENNKTIDRILTNDAILKHYFVRNVSFWWFIEKPIFPRMLILHALMVLIIAFVGQLIISDKSVTEPL